MSPVVAHLPPRPAPWTAGPRLDARIAERVLGLALDWTHAEIRAVVAEDREANRGRGIICRCPGCGRGGFGNEIDWVAPCPTPACRPYSTEIAAAYEVVAGLYAGPALYVSVLSSAHGATAEVGLWAAGDVIHTAADTAPLAICLAALYATGATV